MSRQCHSLAVARVNLGGDSLELRQLGSAKPVEAVAQNRLAVVVEDDDRREPATVDHRLRIIGGDRLVDARSGSALWPRKPHSAPERLQRHQIEELLAPLARARRQFIPVRHREHGPATLMRHRLRSGL